MFIAVSFTIAKTWKQPKCPSTEEEIKNMWYMYTMEYYSAIKKIELMPFAAPQMDLEIITLSEVSQRKTSICCSSFLYKIWVSDLYYLWRILRFLSDYFLWWWIISVFMCPRKYFSLTSDVYLSRILSGCLSCFVLSF